MSPDELAEWDADAVRLLGKPRTACTVRELQHLQMLLGAENAARVADLDRVQAAIADAAECGCDTFTSPQWPDGSLDHGRARLVHTCGRPR